MQFNIPTASVLLLVSAILSVHTSPVPSNDVALIGRSSGEVSVLARDIDLEKRQRGGNGGGAGGRGGAGGAGAGAGGAGRGNGGAGAGAVSQYIRGTKILANVLTSIGRCKRQCQCRKC